MTVAESFSKFLDNIKVDNYEKISQRYKEITKKLNKTYWKSRARLTPEGKFP